MLCHAMEKLEDFRFLPFFVLTSMAIGIFVGKVFGISNYALTPPIDAISALAKGRLELTIPNIISLGVPIGLFMMIYPAMTKVRVEDIKLSFKSPREFGVVAGYNYLVAPFFMFLLAGYFLAGYPDLRTGIILYGFAPCIAMVIVFTYLARGNNALTLVIVALNSLLQMLLIPVYAKLLLGNVDFDVLVVGESVALYLGLPLVLGFHTRRTATSRWGEKGMTRLEPYLNALSIIGLLFTLIVMFALKGDLILQEPSIIGLVALPITIFFLVSFVTTFLLSWRLGLSYENSVSVGFNSTGRDFEIAIAIAITAFNPTVALATVVGPLIEVPVMLLLVGFARRTSLRLFR